MLNQPLNITLTKMKNKHFESYLQDVFAEDYHGCDDDLPDAFEGWLANIEQDEMMELAEEFGQRQYEAGLAEK